MGFDCIHLNLHKTFATPHGGGGPGAGAVGCKHFLADFLPESAIMDEISGDAGTGSGADRPETIQVRSFSGNFLVVVRALTYMMTLGREGVREAAESAVLNANYLMHESRRGKRHGKNHRSPADVQEQFGYDQ